MKKYLLVMVCLLVGCVVVGCNSKSENNKIEYSGYISEIRDGEFELKLNNNGVEDTIIIISDEKDLMKGENVVVVADDIMMLSEPARVNALEIRKSENKDEAVTLPCRLLEVVDSQYIIVSDLEPTEGDMIFTYKVDYSEIQNLPELEKGARLNIKYNGNMTKSIQPLLTAQSIETVIE